jgi:SAM-dependent methyltransferase
VKRSVEEAAAPHDDWAPDYDDENDCPEINECASLVVEHASPGPDDTAVDLGTGTGNVALDLAADAGRVVGRDVSEGMLEQARAKAAERGIENVAFGEGSFREPNVDDPVDVVVSNFAVHHLGHEERCEAIRAVADLDPQRFVMGEGMFFEGPDPEERFFSAETVSLSTVWNLVDVLTDAGFAVTAVEKVHDQIGVLVAERFASG